MHEFFVSKNLLPDGFQYPESYIDLIKGEVPDLEPWHFFYSKLDYRFKGMKERYPEKQIIPFARRSDNDDVACFDASVVCDNPKVLIIHDFASSGWEERGECKDFLHWIEIAKSESDEWKAQEG